MSAIVRDGFQDHAGMVGIVEQAIMEFTNDPAQNGSKGKPTAPGGPKGKAALAAARATIAAARPQYTPEEYAKQPCVDNRERELTGHIYANRDKCKRSHAGTGVQCKHPATAKYGRCMLTTPSVRTLIHFQKKPGKQMARLRRDGMH